MSFRWVAVLCVLGLPLLAGPAAGQIVLNEVLADPAQDWNGDGAVSSRDDEWVEIYNTGSAAVDLSTYRLASADTTWRFGFSGTLEPGGVLVVYGSDSYAWEQATGNPAYGLRLTNSGGEIALWTVDQNTMTLIDCYMYTDHEADDDRSSGRYPDGTGPWVLYDALNPYTGGNEPGGTGCEPSPGSQAVCATPVEKTNWGAVKTRWLEAGGSPSR